MLALELQDIMLWHKIVALGVVTGSVISAWLTPVVGAVRPHRRMAGGRRVQWVRMPGRCDGRGARCGCMVVLAVQGTGVRRGLCGSASAASKCEVATRAVWPIRTMCRCGAAPRWRPGGHAHRAARGRWHVWRRTSSTSAWVAGDITLAGADGAAVLGLRRSPGSLLAPRTGAVLVALGRFFDREPRQHPISAWAWPTRFLAEPADRLRHLELLYFLARRRRTTGSCSGAETVVDGLSISGLMTAAWWSP